MTAWRKVRQFAARPLSGDASLARTLAKGMGVLEAFAAGDENALSNTEVAARTGLPRPTVARLTKALGELGYLAYDQRSTKYRLWGGVLKLAHPVLAALKVRQVARPLMQDFANSVRGTVSLGIVDGLDLIYVETARSFEVAYHTPDIGSSVPLPKAAMGRALWSMLDRTASDALRARFETELPEMWERYRAAVDEGLRECAEQGFCTSRGDWVAQINAVAVPLFIDPDTGGPYAVNCGVPAFRLSSGQMEQELGPRLVSLARSIRVLSGREAGD